MTQQPEAVENYIQQALTTERREWNKLTRELYAQIDTLTAQLETATRQKNEAIDTLATTLEARYNAESTYIEAILERNAEIEQLKARLENEIAYSDTVKKSLFAVMEQRDQLSELLNAERIARQGLAQLLNANR